MKTIFLRFFHWIFDKYKLTSKISLMIGIVFFIICISLNFISNWSEITSIWGYLGSIFIILDSFERDWSNQNDRLHYRIFNNFYVYHPLRFSFSMITVLIGIIYYLKLPNYDAFATVTSTLNCMYSLIWGIFGIFTSIRRLQPKK
ncbi:hypothetical protein [Holzapfeliella sp. JNUCC 80]